MLGDAPCILFLIEGMFAGQMFRLRVHLGLDVCVVDCEEKVESTRLGGRRVGVGTVVLSSDNVAQAFGYPPQRRLPPESFHSVSTRHAMEVEFLF